MRVPSSGPGPSFPFGKRGAGAIACAAFVCAALVVGCDDAPKPGSAAASASASSSAAPSATPAPAKRTAMPEIIVDTDGPYVGGSRINLDDPTGAEKLAKALKDLPIGGKPVTVLAEKKAKVQHVAAVVAALGDAGAPKVVIKTDGRNDLAKEIAVTPESRLGAPPGCSVTALVMKDLSTAVWGLKGGAAKKQRKGLAGPDLSHTGEEVTRELAACDSTMAFFSGDDALPWENAFNLAGTIMASDEKKKIDTLVLLREAPVAGRAVTVAKH